MLMKIPDVKQSWVPWDQWECLPMYDNANCDKAEFDSRKNEYANFLADSQEFGSQARSMTRDWPLSCLNFLTNKQINRVAWIGQSTACYAIGLPSRFRCGFWLLNSEQQERANRVAAVVLQEWIIEHNRNKKQDRCIRQGMGTQMLLEWDSR